jgi:hypothetical protein
LTVSNTTDVPMFLLLDQHFIIIPIVESHTEIFPIHCI